MFLQGSKLACDHVEQVLPHGFLERVGDMGVNIAKLEPQAKILSHSSTERFVSHCGWGSIIESIHYGVPIIGMPMQYDQHLNAKLVVDVGLGIHVARCKDKRLKQEEIDSGAVREVVEC